MTTPPPNVEDPGTRPPRAAGVSFVPDEAMVRLVRERDHLFLLHEALAEVDRARSLEERLRIFAAAIQRIGFGRVVVTVRDAALNPTEIVTAGLTAQEELSLRTASAPGVVWQRRLARMEPLRVSQSYYVDSSDPWAASEFADALRSHASPDDGGGWSPHDFLLVPLRDGQGRIIATLVLDDPTDRSRPTLARVRTVELFAQQVASILERAELVRVAEQRAERLQRLQQAGNALARSLDERAIVRELAWRVERLVGCDGVAVVLRDAVGALERVVRREHGLDATRGEWVDCDEVCDAVVAAGGLVRLDGTGPAPHAVVGVPALSGASVVAVLAVWRTRPAAFSLEDEEVLLTVAAHAATAVSNARLYAASQAERRRSEALADIASAVSSSLRLDDVTHLSLRHAVALLRAEGASLSLLRDGELVVVGAIGSAENVLGSRLPLDGSLSGRALREARYIISNDSATDPGAFQPNVVGAAVRRAIMVPVFNSDGPAGVLTVINRPARFVDGDAEVLQRLADHVGIAVANARLFEEHRALGERYRSVVETTADAIVITDRERRVVFTNPAAERLFGVTGGAVGRPVSELVPPEHRAAIAAREDRALEGHPQRYEATLLRGDGERRLVSVSTSPMHGAGIVTGIVASLRDVTDERRARDAVAQSEARYTRLVESASDGIFTLDGDERLTSVNRSLERAVGRSREELLGEPFEVLLDPRDAAAAAELFRGTFAGDRRRGEVRYRADGGEIRSCSVMTTPIVERDVVVGVLGIVRDVTEEKRLTEQLVQQEKLVAVGQLVSGVAHELNNPLAGVMAFSQLLLAAPDGPPERRAAVETIHQEAKRAAKIVTNLLTFARQHQPERAPTDLNQVLLDTLELRRYALRVAQIDVVLRLDPLLPSTWADAFQLQQVVLNLVTNAEQALDGWQGERRVVVGSSRSGDTLVLRVSDSGPGIAAEHLARIFNPFFTTKPVGQGTGLGLSISDGIVREHGGRIRVESRPGQGATFHVELPLVAAPAPLAPARAPAEEAGDARRRVLVVDDEPAIRTAVASFLRSLGHVVDTPGSAREALERVAAHSYDALVLDLRMPDMSGDVLYGELEARYPQLARRVVFLTGDVHSEPTRGFIAATGRPVVTKPFLLDELAAVVLAEAAS